MSQWPIVLATESISIGLSSNLKHGTFETLLLCNSAQTRAGGQLNYREKPINDNILT